MEAERGRGCSVNDVRHGSGRHVHGANDDGPLADDAAADVWLAYDAAADVRLANDVTANDATAHDAVAHDVAADVRTGATADVRASTPALVGRSATHAAALVGPVASHAASAAHVWLAAADVATIAVVAATCYAVP